MQLLDAKQFRKPAILGNLIVINECNQPVLANEGARDVEGAITRRCYAPLRLHGQLNAKAGLVGYPVYYFSRATIGGIIADNNGHQLMTVTKSIALSGHASKGELKSRRPMERGNAHSDHGDWQFTGHEALDTPDVGRYRTRQVSDRPPERYRAEVSWMQQKISRSAPPARFVAFRGQ